jgi:hypothetical protein
MPTTKQKRKSKLTIEIRGERIMKHKMGCQCEECRKPLDTSQLASVSDSLEYTGYVDKVLNNLHKRIQKAGEAGRGCRITAEEADLLQYNNLPNTTEDICVRDE